MNITNDAVHKVYDLSKKIYHKKCTVKDALEVISSGSWMSEGSARIYFRIFSCLMTGVAHKRAMNEYSTEYFLNSIYHDYGSKAFLVALQSTSAHVTYYNSLNKGRRTSISNIIEELSKKYNVKGDISSIYPDEIEGEEYSEGAARQVYINSYERNLEARNKCIEYYGFDCTVCGFNFESQYGAIGVGFIHVHHLTDLASIGQSYKVDPVKDLRPVCPNCHAMLHKKKPAYSISELNTHLTKQSK